MFAKKGLSAAPAAIPLYVEDVFSTWLYDGNGSTQVIENGIELGGSNTGGSGYFNGSSSLSFDASSVATGSGNFTIEFWFNAASLSSEQWLISSYSGSSPYLGISVDSTSIGVYRNIGSRNPLANDVAPTANTWNHVALVRNSGVVTVYLNGVADTATASGDTNNYWSGGGTVYIANAPSALTPFTGYISNVRIVSGTAVYTGNFTPPTSALTAISGTVLLTCQGDSPFVDNSGNSVAITQVGSPASKSFGPFTDNNLGQGGMVWIKSRSSSTGAHRIFDTVRGATKYLNSALTNAEATLSTTLTSFNSDGFSLSTASAVNLSDDTFTSWSFRKTEKFFDVVTYTGNGVAGRTVAHNLGSVPGCIIVKRTDAATDWAVYHRSLGGAVYFLLFNLTDARGASTAHWNDTNPTSTVFTVGTNSRVNENGATYVAYLFAHDAGGFGDDGNQNIISCGSFTTNSSGNATVSLGYEPQWVMVKSSTATSGWYMFDTMRGLPVSSTSSLLFAQSTNAEVQDASANVNNTGFLTTGLSGSQTYIYIAIRRGPMKTPTDATKVFTPTVYTGTNTDNRLINTTIAPDFVMIRQRNDTVVPGMYTGARLTGQEFLITGSTNAGATDANSFDAQYKRLAEWGNAFSSMSGVWVGNDATRKFNANTTSNNHVIEAFKRAPGFFDVVCYTGTGANRTVSHNLGVAPELMIVKQRNNTSSWNVYHKDIGNSSRLILDLADAESASSTTWNNTTPTSTVFSLGTNSEVNNNGSTYIACLFASITGVSKVGSYTGGTAGQTINCGFSPRFVLIKVYSGGTGDWFVFDTARGLVAGNDPSLTLNATDAEGSIDQIDPETNGFSLPATYNWINGSGRSYIYLAIA